MSKKIIAKFCTIVITATACTFLAGCSFVQSSADVPPGDSSFALPRVVGKIESSDITESSGIAASRCQSDVLWTHNDSGDGPYIFALNGSGGNLGTWEISNAENIDWEDIATSKDKTGKCFLYIGEIGDNKAKRREHTIYRIPEPLITHDHANSNRNRSLAAGIAEMLNFSYPDLDQDAETLMIHPTTDDIYIVTKRVSGPAGVYKIQPEFSNRETQKATRIADLSVPAIPNGFLTGGAISPDGRRMIVCDYTQAYEFSLPDAGLNFDAIWKQTAEPVDLGKRKGGESVTYSGDGRSLFATSEGRNSPLIEVKRR